MFSADDILARLHEQPFIPFRLVTSSGQSYDINHPELVLTARRFLIIGTAGNDNPQIIEAASRVALWHVVDLQDMPSPTPPGTNGSTE